MPQSFTKYTKDIYSQMEKRLLDFWNQDGTFEKSIQNRPKDKTYVFYDGPPFITGLPHHGTLLSSIIKDVIPRFQTMQGYRVERRWGWDCHGLPAEYFVEKKLGLKDKQAVLNYGLEKYIVACRDNMIQTGSLWEESIERVGRWVEFQNAYKTMDASYMESVWWAFKKLYDLGKIYEGEKVLMYCTRCATPVSKAEVAMDNSYQEVNDASVYIKFKLDIKSSQEIGHKLNLASRTDIYMLAWTTTPWTLPANTALAVNPKLNYQLINVNGHNYLIAQNLVETVVTNQAYEYLADIEGQLLVGLTYEPLFEDQGQNAHQVLSADYVLDEEGTGIVHLAPAYGEEDYDLACQFEIPIVRNIDDYGLYLAGEYHGQNVWQVNNVISQQLQDRQLLFKIKDVKHSYPHCHRCQTRLMYKAHASWFLNIADQRQSMFDHNQAIYWFPTHIKDKRFQNIIKTAPDWNISRDRMWATPLPVWRGCDPQTNEIKTIVIGSYEELAQYSGVTLEDYHRPWVDEITFEKEGVTYSRVDKVLDCWFESGSMPFAQYHYPFERVAFFEDNFPADFIAEYVGQVRAWFYYLHAVSTGLFNKPAFTNVIVTGTLLGSDGRKMSKSLGNYADPLELIDNYSADAYRLILMDSPVLTAEDFIVTQKDLADKQRKLDTLRNTLEFFLLYASADNWQADLQKHTRPLEGLTNIFDRWLMARLSAVIHQVTEAFNSYNLPSACKPLVEFIDDLSNWYIRRNRKRFWKTDNDKDKEEAYHSLYFTLYNLAHLIAPICPFLAEEIYQHLTQNDNSVHLSDWPTYSFVDPELNQQMHKIRHYITAGLALRSEAGIKVRQPLTKIVIQDNHLQSLKSNQDLETIILEELNIKEVLWQDSSQLNIQLDTEITLDLRHEGLVRELVRHIQILRKKSNLEVENRIKLRIVTADEDINLVINKFKAYIQSETLAVDFQNGPLATSYRYNQEHLINNEPVVISLEKV